MPPSIRLHIESTRLDYFPPALDPQKSMASAAKPKREFVTQFSTGNEFRWMSGKAEGQPNIFRGGISCTTRGHHQRVRDSRETRDEQLQDESIAQSSESKACRNKSERAG